MRRPMINSRVGLGRAWMLCLIASVCLVASNVAYAYPEFQHFVQKTSGRNVDCAMCHVNPDGPEGLKPGQIGSLNPQEMQQLNKARAAFLPGQNVDNPILNDFGDHIINTLGKQKFLQIRQHPKELAAALGEKSDLDHDGIPDADEFLEGTHPLDAQSGDPWELFVHNLGQYWPHIVLIAVATFLGLFGLNNLLHWFDQQSGRGEENSVDLADDTRA